MRLPGPRHNLGIADNPAKAGPPGMLGSIFTCNDSVQGGGYDPDGKQNSILGEHRFDRGDVVL